MPDALAARHGGSRATWHMRLRSVGLPVHLGEDQLAPSQRAELKRLLAQHSAPVASQQQPEIVPSLREWARACLRRYLETWQPWALAPPEHAEFVRQQAAHRWLQHGPEALAGPPPPLPARDAILAELLRHPALAFCKPHELRLFALLHAATRHADVAEVLNQLAPRVRGRGWPVRLLARIACPDQATAMTLPPTLVRRERVRGIEVLRLQPAVKAKAPPPRPLPTGEAPAAGMLTRLPPLPDDLIPLQLAAHTLASLHDLKVRWQLRERVGVLGGVVGLLAGPYGHGRRTAARQLAHQLGAEIYRVQPGLLTSRFIGETEQRISRMFADVQATGGVLMIEDAQDLMTQRVEVHGSNDRYSNNVVNHLLQEVERFQGLLLLVTPSLRGLDAAMRRRIQVIVRFDEPDRVRRATILRATWLWLLPRLSVPPPDEEPHWPELAAPTLSPADLVHAVCDAGLEVTLRDQPLAHAAIAHALVVLAESRRDVVMEAMPAQ